MTTLEPYRGDCHCGAIGFLYRTALEPADWPIRSCQCRFCRIHAALSASDPRGQLQFVEHVPDAQTRYRFGLRTADFLICRSCGAYIGATMTSELGSFGIINVRVLQSGAELLQEAQPMNYDGEGSAGRTERRERRWTPIRED